MKAHNKFMHPTSPATTPWDQRFLLNRSPIRNLEFIHSVSQGIGMDA